MTQNILRMKISFPIRFALAPEEDILEALRTEAVPDPSSSESAPDPAPEPASSSSAVLVSVDALRNKHPLLKGGAVAGGGRHSATVDHGARDPGEVEELA